MNHTAFQACISILGIVINLCSGAPEFCLTVVSETAEKCFLTGGSQAVNVIACDHKYDRIHDHICYHSSDSQHWHDIHADLRHTAIASATTDTLNRLKLDLGYQ